MVEQDRNGTRGAARMLLIWFLGVAQVVTTSAVLAGVGALWSLSNTVSSLVVEITNIKASQISQERRVERHEAEVKRVSDEQIRRGAIIEELKSRKK